MWSHKEYVPIFEMVQIWYVRGALSFPHLLLSLYLQRRFFRIVKLFQILLCKKHISISLVKNQVEKQFFSIYKIKYISTFTNSYYTLLICTWFLKDWVWKIKLDELDFLSILNLNFAGYTRSKNQFQTRQKIKFTQLDFSNSMF